MNTVSEQPEKIDRGTLAALYEETFRNIEEGTITEGRVVNIQRERVVVDIGYKSEGMIPADQFSGDELKTLSVNDTIQVYIEQCEDSEGNLLLSKEKADKMKVWEDLEVAHRDDKEVQGKVLSRIKGGMMVDIGVKAFLPGSQIDLTPIRDLDSLVGKTFTFIIIKINHRRGNVVVSRRALLEETRDKKRQTTLSTLNEGQLIEGTVKNITDYGAFLDLGGIDGLLHITDISWGRVGHPSELYQMGDEITVKVLSFDRERERVSLGIKQLTEDPWSNADEKYPIGQKIAGKIVSLTDYGAFVELVPGVEGMVHISELSWSRVEKTEEAVQPGDKLEVKVLRIEPGDKQMKISLSVKQISGNPWDRVGEDVDVGQKVTGKVIRCATFGAFVEIMPGIEGLVHISEMSYTKRVIHPEDIVKPGQTVSVLIKEVDPVKRRIGLSIRDAEGDPWLDVEDKFTAGQPVKGTVEKREKFGMFIALAPGIVGLLPKSVIKGSSEASRIETLKPGDDVEVVVQSIQAADRRISLGLGESDDAGDWRQFSQNNKGRDSGGLGALGDKLAEALKKK